MSYGPAAAGARPVRNGVVTRTRSRLAVLPLLAALASACATPVGVTTAPPRAIHRYLTQNALSAAEPSTFSLIELRRYDLLDAYDDDPDAALARLHEVALGRGLPAEALFALAELSFLRAEQTRDAGRYAASALYAWAFLFPEEPRASLDPLDPRGRIAADLYNRSLACAFQRGPGGAVEVRTGGLDLPFGHFTPQPGALPDLGGWAIASLFPVAELEVRGLRNRYRRPGIGAPLAATLAPTPATATQPVPLPETTQLPLTAVARVENPLAQIRSGQVAGRVELYPTLDVDQVEIDGGAVALEAEPTAALAAGLSESRFWEQELRTFFGDLVGARRRSELVGLTPYTAGRIPAVFVHGTASSAGRWADMVNDLVADDRLRHRYSFWFFRYDSGNPIAYSGSQLRDALTRAISRADPSRSDPCLQDVLVLGHSQGGLLAKLTVIDSGDAFWRRISDQPFDSVDLAPEDRELVRNVAFVKPQPYVKRVVFLATPHRGSYLAGPQLLRRLVHRFVTLPSDVVRAGASLGKVGPNGAFAGGRVGTSIDNMAPGDPFIRTLAAIPVAEGVAVHSIISVDDERPLDQAGDGVVKYRSAHIDGVESELVVHSPHSGMQAAPATVEEVRRIFLEHSAASACPLPASGS